MCVSCAVDRPLILFASYMKQVCDSTRATTHPSKAPQPFLRAPLYWELGVSLESNCGKVCAFVVPCFWHSWFGTYMKYRGEVTPQRDTPENVAKNNGSFGFNDDANFAQSSCKKDDVAGKVFL